MAMTEYYIEVSEYNESKNLDYTELDEKQIDDWTEGLKIKNKIKIALSMLKFKKRQGGIMCVKSIKSTITQLFEVQDDNFIRISSNFKRGGIMVKNQL